MRIILLLYLAAAAAQTPAASKNSLPSSDGAMSAAFRTAAIEAASCLDSLSDGMMDKGPGYGIQRFHCSELINRCGYMAANKSEKEVAGPLGLLRVKLDLCRLYADNGTSAQFSGCLKDAQAIGEKISTAINPGRAARESTDAKRDQ